MSLPDLFRPCKLHLPLLASVLPLLLSACNTMPMGPTGLNDIYNTYEKSRVAYYKQQLGTGPGSGLVASTKQQRNDIINDFILMIDSRYDHVEKHFYDSKAWTDFGGSVVGTGLGTAAVLTGSSAAKTTLAALVTAIESTKTSFSKDVLQGQNMIAITAQMRKLRSQKLLQIRQSMAQSPADYPLSEAFIDLMAYNNAGTFVVALQSLTEEAAASKQASDQGLADLKGVSAPSVSTPTPAPVASRRTTTGQNPITKTTKTDPEPPINLGPDANTKLLVDFIMPDGKTVNKANQAEVTTWIKNNAKGVDQFHLLDAAEQASNRAAAVKFLKLPR